MEVRREWLGDSLLVGFGRFCHPIGTVSFHAVYENALALHACTSFNKFGKEQHFGDGHDPHVSAVITKEACVLIGKH